MVRSYKRNIAYVQNHIELTRSFHLVLEKYEATEVCPSLAKAALAFSAAGGYLATKSFYLKFTFTPFVIHVANLAEYCSLSPSLVVDAPDRPHASDVSIGIVSIETVAVVEIDRAMRNASEGFSVHSSIFFAQYMRKNHVHLPCLEELNLRRVPQIVVCACTL